MNNAKPPAYVTIELELFGGLFTEATPESLPSGAAALSINTDYQVGSVIPRPGKFSAFYYVDFFVEKGANFASSVPDGANEVAWSNPHNATLDIPGTYASAALNTSSPATNGPVAFDNFVAGNGSGTAVTTPPATPSFPNAWALFLASPNALHTGSFSPNGSWVSPGITFPSLQGVAYQQSVTGPVAGDATYSNGAATWSSLLLLFELAGPTLPTFQQNNATSSGAFLGLTDVPFPGPNTANNMLMAIVLSENGGDPLATITDTAGNIYTQIGQTIGGGTSITVYLCTSCVAAVSNTVHFNIGAVIRTASLSIVEIVKGTFFAPSSGTSEILKTLNFPFSIPEGLSLFGFEVEVSGKQTNAAADAIITVSLGSPAIDSPTFSTQLPASNGTVTVATPTTNWGLTLTPDLFNDPNFTIDIKASALSGSQVTFDIYSVKIKIFITPQPPPSINYLKTFQQTDGVTLNLALGSDGVFYQENAIDAPDQLEAVYTAIEPDSFAQSCTQDNREYIAISDLSQGTDIPYTYTPPNFDRLSQVGPGAPPTASSNSVGNSIVQITQPTAKSDPASPGHMSQILWSAGPGNTSPGNILTVYYAMTGTHDGHPGQANPDPDLVIGGTVALAGFAAINGQVVDGDYQIIALGQQIPPNAEFARWYFAVTMPTSQFFNNHNGEPSSITGTYQVTLATMETTSQVPNLEVGSQFQIAGTGGSPPTGYDGTYNVLSTPNASQVKITATVLNGNVATYSYVLETGTNPTAGETITVTGTLNGNGAFNVSNLVIQSATPGTFSLSIVHADVASAAENGSGVVFGTLFTFEPGQIVGTRLGGTIVTSGIIGAGVRKVCYSFLTRNGFLTQPSPILTFSVASGASVIVIGGLLPGPPNVVARVIHLTAADGGNFYNIPIPVTVEDNGQKVINTSTWVLDNTSAGATLSFSDSVLLAADEIDVQGNNLFECAELGSLTMLIPYAQRLFAIGEQNKISNLLNYSFDGGFAATPPGWVVDPTNGAGGSLISSPIFGFAYAIANATGILQATYGMITQNAFQDEFGVAIVDASTLYSVRVTCLVTNGGGGSLVIDLFSAQLNRIVGSFSVPFSEMSPVMQIFTGTLLTTVLAPVPNDLILRVYATNIPDGAEVVIDRLEPFPTEEPNLDGQVTGSYQGDFESFDQLTGPVNCSVQNQQPVKSAFTLFDALYLVKTHSFLSTSDNKATEPSQWSPARVISNSVGTTSVYGVTSGIDQPNAGEEWAIIAGIAGAFIFNGGEPVKLSEEIQSLWDFIYWKMGHLLWVTNDIINRRILFGVPMRTMYTDPSGKVIRNKWIPEGVMEDTDSPTFVNCILDLNYKQLNTAGLLTEQIGVRTSYSAKLIAREITRKWAIWTVRAPCAAFLTRDDKTAPLFIGNSEDNGKIFQLIEGLLEDDGAAFAQMYRTFGFVQGEAGQGSGMGIVRYNYDYMTMIIDGSGALTITVYPNTVESPYSHTLLPDLTLPASTNGDVEVPINECGSRLFLMFTANAVGAGYTLSRIVMIMHQDPWAPVRGVNN